MRTPAALLLIAISATLAGCSETATAKVEVTLRSTAGNDGKIVAFIPKGSAMKVSKCSHGWCQVSWNGHQGYALAKNFSVPALANSTTETGADDDKQDDGDGSND